MRRRVCGQMRREKVFLDGLVYEQGSVQIEGPHPFSAHPGLLRVRDARKDPSERGFIVWRGRMKNLPKDADSHLYIFFEKVFFWERKTTFLCPLRRVFFLFSLMQKREYLDRGWKFGSRSESGEVGQMSEEGPFPRLISYATLCRCEKNNNSRYCFECEPGDPFKKPDNFSRLSLKPNLPDTSHRRSPGGFASPFCLFGFALFGSRFLSA